jgi:hypothetical protein
LGKSLVIHAIVSAMPNEQPADEERKRGAEKVIF